MTEILLNSLSEAKLWGAVNKKNPKYQPLKHSIRKQRSLSTSVQPETFKREPRRKDIYESPDRTVRLYKKIYLV